MVLFVVVSLVSLTTGGNQALWRFAVGNVRGGGVVSCRLSPVLPRLTPTTGYFQTFRLGQTKEDGHLHFNC